MEEKLIEKMLLALGELKEEIVNLKRRIGDLEKRGYTDMVTRIVNSRGSFGHCVDAGNGGGNGHCR